MNPSKGSSAIRDTVPLFSGGFFILCFAGKGKIRATDRNRKGRIPPWL